MKCLAPQLSDRRVSISLPSLRAEAFSVGLADAVSEVRKSGFTFAPETGSDRLRRVINKTFTNADMIAAADVAFARGWDLIKVYTMIGLPTETVSDLDELVTLVEGILAQGRKHGRKQVNVSVGSFVPKSWTPFQWAPFDGVETLERKLRYLKEKFRSVRGAKMKWHEPREAEIECALSRGDRRMGRVLHTAWKSGVRFDGWTEHFRHDLWMKAFEAEGIPKESYLREYGLDEVLPWDVLDVSIKKRWLQIELIKAKKEMRTEDCKWGHCYACGVPGNGEDTVLARPMDGALPTFDAATAPATDPAAYRDVAKGAAYRQKAMPDLPSAARRGDTGRPRLSPPHHLLEDGRRAVPVAPQHDGRARARDPRRGAARALLGGVQPAHEALDGPGARARPREPARGLRRRGDRAVRRRTRPRGSTRSCPRGSRSSKSGSSRAAEPALSKAVKGARYTVRLDSPEQVGLATEALANGWREAMPALKALSVETDRDGARLAFEVNLDQSAGETSTAKKVLEKLLAIAPADQASLSVVREATILAG